MPPGDQDEREWQTRRAKLETLCDEPLFSKAKLNMDESRTLAEIREALLPKLLSGEIRVGAAEKVVGVVA